MLYLIATPIGHLGDITYRAVELLQTCEYLLCEDTRRSSILLKRYGVSKPLKSYHKFNEAKREKEVITHLKEGQTIGLLSDAGTPGICDPATRLVLKCRDENLEVSAAPGPCAAIMALSISGFKTHRFQFLGFPPKKKNQLKNLLTETFEYPGVSIFYESPHRIRATLELLQELAPDLRVAIGRELTKIHEECLRGTPAELLAKLSHPKGEFVLLIDGLL